MPPSSSSSSDAATLLVEEVFEEDERENRDLPESKVETFVNQGASSVSEVKKPDVIRNGVNWTKCEVNQDEHSTPDQPTLFPKFIPNVLLLSVLYTWRFMTSFLVSLLVPHTSARLGAKEPPSPPVTEIEMEKWIGITLARVFHTQQGKQLWTESVPEGSVQQAPNFGQRFEMTRDRFFEIQANWRVGSVSPAEEAKDGFARIRPAIAAFNTHREEEIVPGTWLCVDELMSRWYGAEGAYKLGAAQGKVKIQRKPQGVGFMFKCLLDCYSGIMMRLELQEGEGKGPRDYEDRYGVGTAVTLRLTKGWGGKGRIVVANSAFASVTTAIALMVAGFFFMGMVKTATLMFPILFLQSIALERGQHQAMEASVQGHKVFAAGWQDKTLKTLVATCGTTIDSTPAVKKKYQTFVSEGRGVFSSLVETFVPRCQFFSNYFDHAHRIDVHDHYRQGILCLEEVWLTRDWISRLFTTLLGICVVDAYFAHCFFVKVTTGKEYDKSFLQFVDALSYALIHAGDGEAGDDETIPSGKKRTRSQSSSSSSSSSGKAEKKCAEGEDGGEGRVTLDSISHLPQYTSSHGGRIRCKICGVRASLYCTACTPTTQIEKAVTAASKQSRSKKQKKKDTRQIVAVCGPKTGRDCFFQHIMQAHVS